MASEEDQTNWGRYLGLGLEMAVGTVLGLLVGRWIDRRVGSEPWGVLIGTMLGLASGMYLLIKESLRLNK